MSQELINQSARFKMCLECSYFWCIKTETILNDTSFTGYYFGLAGQIEHYMQSKYILN